MLNERLHRLIQMAHGDLLDDESRKELRVLAKRAHYHDDMIVNHSWVGEVLLGIECDGGGELRAKFAHGRKGRAEAWGDCCASVWFEHIEITNALGGVVLAVLEKGWDDYTKPFEYGDVEEVCFWTIITDKGTVDIETRLSHNGYYGGYVDWHEPTEDHEATN